MAERCVVDRMIVEDVEDTGFDRLVGTHHIAGEQDSLIVGRHFGRRSVMRSAAVADAQKKSLVLCSGTERGPSQRKHRDWRTHRRRPVHHR